jgi:hypothetical protein
VRSNAKRIAFDGTSATALIVNSKSGEVLVDAKLYNEAQPQAAVQAAVVRKSLTLAFLS